MSNINFQTTALVDDWSGLLDEIAELQVKLKDLKARAKEDGWNLKALAQCVKEKRKGAEFSQAQLTLELEVTTYRQAAGLPATLEAAQKAVAAEARGGALGAPDALEEALSDPAFDGTSLSINDGPFHELGSARKRKLETVQ